MSRVGFADPIATGLGFRAARSCAMKTAHSLPPLCWGLASDAGTFRNGRTTGGSICEFEWVHGVIRHFPLIYLKTGPLADFLGKFIVLPGP